MIFNDFWDILMELVVVWYIDDTQVDKGKSYENWDNIEKNQQPWDVFLKREFQGFHEKRYDTSVYIITILCISGYFENNL